MRSKIVVFLLIVPLWGACADLGQKKQTDQNSGITIDSRTSQVALPAWLGYASARLAGAQTNEFACEVQARGFLVKIWKRSKESQKSGDEYLDQLEKVEAAGYLSEYVWTYLRTPAWGAEPAGLKLDEFRIWRSQNLQRHVPRTMAMETSRVKARPLSPWSQDKEADAEVHYFSGYRFPRQVGKFARAEHSEFDPAGHDVSMAYNWAGTVVLTFYVYPPGSPGSQAEDTLPLELRKCMTELEQYHPGALMLAKNEPAKFGAQTFALTAVVYEMTERDSFGHLTKLHSRLLLGNDADHFVKLRITYPAELEKNVALAVTDFLQHFPWPARP